MMDIWMFWLKKIRVSGSELLFIRLKTVIEVKKVLLFPRVMLIMHLQESAPRILGKQNHAKYELVKLQWWTFDCLIEEN